MGSDGWPARRAVLTGLGALGTGMLAPWDGRARAEDKPRPVQTQRIAPSALGTGTESARLYEEDPANPSGRMFYGTVAWSTGREKVADITAANATELVLRAKVVMPNHGMGLQLTLRRNDDKSLPASHVVDVKFELAAGFQHGGIQNVPGMLVKDGESQRGMPLAGLAVKVTNGYFLIGLSGVEKESQRNITLLKEKPWFDIPIVYTDGRRAILAIEKGRSGERAFGQAFAAWGSPAPGSATPDRKGSPAVGKGDRVPPSPAAPPDSIKTPLEDSEP